MKTNLSLSHELGFIKSFIVKEKQERFLLLTKGKKSRNKLRLLLAHKISLNIEKITPLKKEDDNIESIYEKLKNLGSPDNCHLICESIKFDNKNMKLRNAIEELYYTDYGCVISCIPGKLAYFQGEDVFNRAILIS